MSTNKIIYRKPIFEKLSKYLISIGGILDTNGCILLDNLCFKASLVDVQDFK